MEHYGNMGPFGLTNFKGSAKINGVPVFVDKLPLTIGGLAGEDIKFGRVVSIDPSKNRREFVAGIPGAGYVVKGISMLNPAIMRTDPAMQDFYFAGRPMTATTMGIIEINEFDLSQDAPSEGSTVWCRNADGVIAFNNGTDISASGYTKLNAYVYETLDPNGAKVAFGMPSLLVSQTRENVPTSDTPVASPAAGEVPAGTQVTISAEDGATIYYTLDGSTPTVDSPVYSTPIEVSAPVTIKAVAVVPGKDPSTVLSAAYTLA
jgi:hypothetical protein